MIRGIATAILLLVPVAAVVVVLERLVLADATRRDQAFAGVLVVTGGSILALGAGGWIAGRVSAPRTTSRALGIGLAAGVAAVAAIVVLTYALLGETMDFHSVGVALGMTDVPASDLSAAPFAPGQPKADYDVSPPDLARRRTLTSLAFVTAWAVLAVTAAALGALAGASRKETTS